MIKSRKIFSIVGIILIVSITLFALFFVIWAKYSTKETIRRSLKDQFKLKQGITNMFFDRQFELLHFELERLANHYLMEGEDIDNIDESSFLHISSKLPDIILFKKDGIGEFISIKDGGYKLSLLIPFATKRKDDLIEANNIIRLKTPELDVSLLLSSIHLNDSKYGTGHLFGAYILNDNYSLLEKLKQKNYSENILIIEGNNIVASTILIEDPIIKELLEFQQHNISGTIKPVENVIASYFNLSINDKTSSFSIILTSSQQFVEATENSNSITLLIGLFLVILFFWSFLFIIKQMTLPPFQKLIDYATKIKTGDHDVKYEQGIIEEFNDLGKSLEIVFEKFLLSAKELRESQQFVKSIVNSMPSIIIGVDENGIITHWNKNAERHTDIFEEDAIGKHFLDVYSNLDIEMLEIYASILTQKVKNKSIQKIISDNKKQYFDITIYPLLTDDGKGAVVRIDDVTDSKIMEEALLQSGKMDAIGQLAGGVAHDFNNMLGGIIGAAELLKYHKNSLDEKDLKFVDMILQASERASDLTSKLLAFGRKGKNISTAVSIDQIIFDTVDILNKTIDKKIKITVNQKAEKIMVIGDNSGLQNALMNLGINASHAMPDGGELYIETKNINFNKVFCDNSSFDLEPGEYILIEVRDTGCGIPTENLQKIFEPFYTTKKLGKGTGLGLAAVYGMVQDHKGSITVNSIVGKGTSFYINLPCSDSEISPRQMVDNVVTGVGQVLLVDDEEIMRVSGKLLLENLGYEVLLAENGAVAVEVFKEHFTEIDLVLMDMIMPEMNGREAFFKMKEIDESCKVIISSGFAKEGNIAELKSLGLCGFIQKPYRNFELSKVLSEVMG